MANERSASGGRFILDINGERAGIIKSFQGFDYQMEAIVHDLGAEIGQMKSVGNLKYTPCKFQTGLGIGRELYEWIKSAFDKNVQTKSGTFTAGDFNYKATSSIDFQDALITSVVIPALDATSKEQGYLTVSCEAERVRHMKGNGADIRGAVGVKQKAWTLANFRFTMGDLPTGRTSKIESIELKCAVIEDRIGSNREPTKHAAKVTIPDLTFEISAADMPKWAEKAEDWFVRGNCEAAHELQGSIEFLDPTLGKTIGSIELKNCGFLSFELPESKANAETVKRFKVKMYVEGMVFDAGYTDPAK